MPKITHAYKISEKTQDEVCQHVLLVAQEIKGEDIKQDVAENGVNRISMTVPSVWGWGGMRLGTITTTQGGSVVILVEGYIAQLATSPLKQVMGEFLNKLTIRIGQDKIVPVEKEAIRGLNLPEAIITKGKDSKMVVFVLLIALVPVVAGQYLGGGLEFYLISLVLILGYFFGKRMFYKE